MNLLYAGWVLLVIGGFLLFAVVFDVILTAVERRAIRRSKWNWAEPYRWEDEDR